MHDFVRIVVGGLLLGGAGGPAQSTGGTLGPQSAGVDPDFLLSNTSVVLNFGKANSDTLSLFGFFDPTVVPVSLLQTNGSFTVGSKSYTFGFDNNGRTVTSSTNLRFSVNTLTGQFNLNLNNEDLSAVMAAVGATNTTNIKPGIDVVLPLTISYANTTYTANVTGKYISQAGKTGRFFYLFNNTGTSDAGYFHVFGVAAAQSGKTPNRVFDFTVVGNGGPPLAPMAIATAGSWTFSIGNFSQSIPVSSFKLAGKIYQYNAPKGNTGITQFLYNPAGGRFTVTVKGIPGEGSAAVGMPLTDNIINRADMAVSLDLATSTGTDFQGSSFGRFVRAKAAGPKWKTR